VTVTAGRARNQSRVRGAGEPRTECGPLDPVHTGQTRTSRSNELPGAPHRRPLSSDLARQTYWHLSGWTRQSRIREFGFRAASVKLSTAVRSNTKIWRMTENSNDSPDKPKGSVSWTSEDRKLLIITIAATVIANIVTIIIVALSIIALRWMRPVPGATRGDYAVFWLFSLAPISTVFLTFIWVAGFTLRQGSQQWLAGEPLDSYSHLCVRSAFSVALCSCRTRFGCGSQLTTCR
jgi:hypothetical protein